jgi:ABC-type taurine transport system ATPase subunit
MQAVIEQVWQDKGFTAIVVTHDVTEAVALADRILLLGAGRVAMDVTVDLPRPRRRGDPAAAIEGRILSLLAQGETQEAILDDYPGLQPEDIRACLAYAHAVLANDRLDDVVVAHV